MSDIEYRHNKIIEKLDGATHRPRVFPDCVTVECLQGREQ